MNRRIAWGAMPNDARTVFVVTKRGATWCVTHAPSGKDAMQGIRRRRDARALATALAAVPDCDGAVLPVATLKALFVVVRDWQYTQLHS